MTAAAVLTFWMPLENEVGSRPGSANDSGAPSAVVDPSGWPTSVPVATVIVVPAGSVSGVPAESATLAPLGRGALTLVSSVARVLSAIGVSGCSGWPDGGFGCGR